MNAISRLLGFGLPLTLVTIYRLVPAPVRGRYPYAGRGPSSSHLAVAGLWRGESWGAIRSALQVNGESWQWSRPW
jgi:hypothetical protein